jgi:hypothetical protein
MGNTKGRFPKHTVPSALQRKDTHYIPDLRTSGRLAVTSVPPGGSRRPDVFESEAMRPNSHSSSSVRYVRGLALQS